MSTLVIRYELFGGGVTVKWRPFISTRHATLCAQAGLDPVRHWFSVPESFHRVGNGTVKFNGRTVGGFIMRSGVDRPVGKVSLAYEGERFRDDDPRSREDFERL